MGTYFKVYHKRSRELVATFNEKQIVDFCISNKESIKKYIFETGGQKDIMEWEVFALKYAPLFVQKAKEREDKERQVSESVEIEEPSKLPWLLLVGVAGLVVAIVAGAAIYYYMTRADSVRRVHDLSAPAEETPKPAEPAPTATPVLPAKRDPIPGDTAFSGKVPDDKTLSAAWSKVKKGLTASLAPMDIKEEMDKYLPALETCFKERAQAGDRNLRGTVNMKIRVAGDGTVLDVLFTDDKYRSTLFSDCIGKAIKGQKFRPFKSKEQVFTYYYEL
ncbi:MAG TPA: AgmX/PglI C-terminal domain-containing protein [bacterium]|nr:AgmX/PglI C-terminal domain-containing protein [bacterium]